MSKPQELTPFGHALAGALGGVFSNAVVYPLDTVKTRIQAAEGKGKDKAKALSVWSSLFKILREEGFGGYYKGFGASMLNTFSLQYAYFFFYSFVRNTYTKRVTSTLPKGAKPPPMSTAVELILGAVAGALAQIFTIPVAVIATRQQLAGGPSRPLTDTEKAAGVKREDAKDNSFMGVAREIIKEDGVMGLWTGLRPGLVLTVNPAITYGMFERLKTALHPDGRRPSPWMAFILGATSKTLATVATYPYIMAKVRLQARHADDGAEKLKTAEEGQVPLSNGTPNGASPVVKQRYHGAIDVLRRVWQDQGFFGWYQGMGAQITKAVLSQALLFMLKDQFERYALVIMTFYAKLSGCQSQRAQLLNQLREVNENREKVDLEESKAQKEHVLLCDDIRRKVQELTDGEYATAKREVDKLRQELGLDPSKTIESQLEEKARKRRNSTNGGVGEASQSTVNPEPIVVASPQKRGPGRPPKVVTAEVVDGPPPPKRPRGRPKGSKNKPKDADPNASERPVS
ncbi:ADP/ATP carrier protein [Tulasnella sp. 403]|nr:ADP/ATP carrier protein [Tulasnella sp. 403]